MYCRYTTAGVLLHFGKDGYKTCKRSWQTLLLVLSYEAAHVAHTQVMLHNDIDSDGSITFFHKLLHRREGLILVRMISESARFKAEL